MEELKISPELEDPEEALFIQEYGFTEIVEILSESKIPIIGHNMIYDVMLLYHQFLGDFPETYEEFTKKWSEAFPMTYDTKLLSSYCKKIKKTWLEAAYTQCIEDQSLKEFIQFEYSEGFGRYKDGGQAHEAAYDAYMTGVLFATIAKNKEIMHEVLEENNDNLEIQKLKFDK